MSHRSLTIPTMSSPPSHTVITTSVRPPAPIARQVDPFTRPRLRLRHPGYGNSPDDILLTLPAVDIYDDPTSLSRQLRPGLHHRTLLTAGAIIANNVFERAYLTRDQAGRRRVDVSLDGILEPGDYWLQLGGNEIRSRVDASRNTQGGDALDTRSSSSPSPPSTPPPVAKAYPVVPSFRDWQFPHDKLPPEWKCSHHAPPSQLPMPSTPAPPASSVCCITGYRMSRNKSHLIPSNQHNWFASNGMHQYASSLPGRINDNANITIMRADIHLLYDQHRFAIIPKPSSPSASSPPGTQNYAFAAHILKDDEDSGELCELYHKIAVQPSSIDKLSREFLFARFAWSLFSHLQPFLESPTSRHLAVRHKSQSQPPEAKWMNNKEWVEYQARRGESRDGSRKRSSSQISREEAGLGCDDAYQERRDRRSHSLDNEDAEESDLDERPLNENTRWSDKVGQFAAYHSDIDSDVDSDSDRGRSPTARLGHFPPDSGGTPRLSRSVTTCGSKRSSVLGSFMEEEYGPGHSMIAGSAPVDKVIRADEARHDSVRDLEVGDGVPL